jgi:cytochrome oxidase Cu insertion factor (SCO1/SenC/PrrC family)
MKHITLFLLIVTGVLWGQGVVGLAARHAAPVAVGTVAPPFSLTLLSGETLQLTDFRGKVLVLNFWASW